MKRIIALGALAVGLAAQASAVSFRFQFEAPITTSGGTSSISALATSDPNTNQVFNLPGATTPATALTYSFPSALGAFTNGTGRVFSNTGSLGFTFVGNSSSTGMDGTLVTFLGGTGAYVGYTGTGVVSHTVNGSNALGQFFANIQPTPEPGTLAALSLAGVALVRRRRAVR